MRRTLVAGPWLSWLSVARPSVSGPRLARSWTALLGGAAILCMASAWTAPVRAQDLVVDGTTRVMAGTHRFREVRVVNGGVIRVTPFDGTNRETTGNLVLVAERILVDATSHIDARGAGYQVRRCGDGVGPTTTAGGRGGCAVRDSGGGGAHFGNGGRGTKDCDLFGSATSCQFPQEFEESCGNSLNAAGTACSSTSDCRGAMSSWDGLPTVAGASYFHTAYDVEFGAAGGDKGCRDGDGFGSAPTVGGAGGGRIVLVGLDHVGGAGLVRIEGRVSAAGKRGCGIGNDSGGGGAGGSVLIVGDRVEVGGAAMVSAAGGLGGDTRAANASQPDSADCAAGAQASGVCDDCGGGGGGGIVTVLSRTSSFASGAVFDVSGADGGTCDICRGEAGGGAGELQLDGAYVGELCDGYDNDFDGATDESLGTTTCGVGPCATVADACDASAGEPTQCVPDVGMPACLAPRDTARPRVAVILDTSASMLLDLSGYPTFGDGSRERPGLDLDGNGRPDDSRLFLAREALASVISAYPEIDFALARYHQDQAEGRACQLASWFECAGLIASYDDPTDNTGAVRCNVAIGPDAADSVAVRPNSTGDECINYAGSCGPPRRGADVLSGFGTPTRDLVRWLDGRETRFSDIVTPGDVCAHSAGNDCEVRASGPTPLAGSLLAVEDYVVPIRTTDPQAACRGYTVVLVTDGAESCSGDPIAAARRLHDVIGVDTYVIAVSVRADEEASLNAIAAAGSGGTRPTATFVRRPEELVPALTEIIEGSIRFERCNGADDDCDGAIDEGFADLGAGCDDGGRGICRGRGAFVCRADELGTECRIDAPGASPTTESCNGADDDCDEAVDEGLTCGATCTPTGADVCNAVDDDCDGAVDEGDPALGMPCGDDRGACEPGMLRCAGGTIMCLGGTGPRDEVCNGIDDDCDGVADRDAVCPGASRCVEGACRRVCDPAIEFPCAPGYACVRPEGADAALCLPTACASCAPNELCRDDACVDPCASVDCPAPARCVLGECVDCRTEGCEPGELCRGGECVVDACAAADCGPSEACVLGACVPPCSDDECGDGRRCGASGECEVDPCDTTSCDPAEICIDGSCREPVCGGVVCPVGTTCVPAEGCVDDPCATTRCPAGRTCVVRADGRTNCARDVPVVRDAGVERPYVLATGGGGATRCSAGPPTSSDGGHGGAGTWGWLGAALALGWTRRRRSR